MKNKISYIILIYIILIITPINAFAADATKGRILYGIQSVETTNESITIKGWSYLNGVNTIGGKNYKITFYAHNDNTSSSVSKSGNKIKYSGKNGLYPFTCYRTGSKCSQVYPGYFKYKINGEVDRSSARAYSYDTPIATCQGGTTSCIHYDPWFEVTFKYDEIKTETNYKEGDSISFKMEVDYKDYGEIKVAKLSTTCYWNYISQKYENCNSTNANTTKLNIAFDKAAISSDGSMFSAQIKNNEGTQFENLTNYGKIGNGYYGGTLSGNYFEYESPQNKFKISGSQIKKFEDKDLGIDTKLRYYELETGTSYPKNGFTYYPPGETYKYVAPSAWGTVTGSTKITFYEGEKPPDDVCYYEELKNDARSDPQCEDRYYKSSCTKQVKLDTLTTAAVNSGNCSQKGEVTAIMIYDLTEKTVIGKGELFKQNACVYAWPGIKWCQPVEWTVTRTVKWKKFNSFEPYTYANKENLNAEATSKTVPLGVTEGKKYYKIKRHYKNKSGVCTTEEGYISDRYLRSLNETAIYNYLENLDNKFEEKMDTYAESKYTGETAGYTWGDEHFEERHVRKASKNKFAYKLGFPISYEYKEYKNENGFRYNDQSNIITVTTEEQDNNKESNTFVAIEKFEIKTAYLKDTDVKYKDENPGGYTDGGHYYYFPYNVPLGEIPDSKNFTFGFGVDLKSTIQNYSIGDITSDKTAMNVYCRIELSKGNLETMNYRVIDLSNPFPNVEPYSSLSGDSRAVNWINLYKNKIKDNFDYLKERTEKENNPEMYKVELTQDNIKKIRDYNKKELEDDKSYINATLNINGASEYINNNSNIFTIRENADYTSVGTKGSDPS